MDIPQTPGSKPRRQHFIPRAYLKNFAENIESDKYVVEALNLRSGKLQYPISIADICISKNIYTFPRSDDSNKFLLETFYANNIDNIYPEVYQLLVNPAITAITEIQRRNILSVCMSLYFRNARFLDEKMDELDEIFEKLRLRLSSNPDSTVFFLFDGRRYEFPINDLDKAYEEAVMDVKEAFILSHFKQWQDFLNKRQQAQITVHRVVPDVPLITSDNPVYIDFRKSTTRDIFDPGNIIQLPLDSTHYLWIAPEHYPSDRLMIYRTLNNKRFGLQLNHLVQQTAGNWIIGAKGKVQLHLDQQEQYGANTPENRKDSVLDTPD